MVGKSLGLIETVGLAAAVEAVDAALKAANVELIGYELTNGGGMVLVKFSGDVGAVKMAVEAGSLAAKKVNKVVATHVIPRPHQQLSCVLATKEIPTREVPVATEVETNIQVETEVAIDLLVAPNIKDEIPEESGEQPQTGQELLEETEIEIASIELDNDDEPSEVVASVQQAKNPADLCNFCGDPACHRKKGDPKITCIHYGGKNNEEAE